MEKTGENTKAGAIDTALAHYLKDYRQKEQVIADLDPEIADALSTAVFVLGPARGLQLIESFHGADALLITKSGQYLRTPGFPQVL